MTLPEIYPAYFLNIDTPINGQMRQYFRITNENDEEVPYIGRVESIDLNNAPWTELKAGEKIEFEVDLLNNYAFTSNYGSYTIDYVFL